MTSGSVTVLIGTTKGVFLLLGGAERAGWTGSGPHCDGWPITETRKQGAL